jgi:hypothetical protein
MSVEWLILHAGALGDLALTLQLACRLPGVSAAGVLRVVSRTDLGDLSKCRPAVHRQSAEGQGLHWLHVEGGQPPPDRLRALVAGRHVLSAVAGVDSVVHRRLQRLGAQVVYSFDPRPRPDLDTHITAQWQRELEQQGLDFARRPGRRPDEPFCVPDELPRHGRHAFELVGAGGQPILVHPGSGGRSKCWPLPCFLDVGRRLRAANVPVCFVIGPVELERWSVAELDAIRAEFPLISAPEPNELLGLLTAAKAFLSNDCGPAHLAALVGTRTVTIFGPTSSTIWRPLGRNARVIAGDPASHPDDWGISLKGVVSEVLGCVADVEPSS